VTERATSARRRLLGRVHKDRRHSDEAQLRLEFERIEAGSSLRRLWIRRACARACSRKPTIRHLSRRSFLVAQARELRPKRIHVHDEARAAWNRIDAARGYAHELLVVSRRSALENLDRAQSWID